MGRASPIRHAWDYEMHGGKRCRNDRGSAGCQGQADAALREFDTGGRAGVAPDVEPVLRRVPGLSALHRAARKCSAFG
jgi:hypothetical protein